MRVNRYQILENSTKRFERHGKCKGILRTFKSYCLVSHTHTDCSKCLTWTGGDQDNGHRAKRYMYAQIDTHTAYTHLAGCCLSNLSAGPSPRAACVGKRARGAHARGGRGDGASKRRMRPSGGCCGAPAPSPAFAASAPSGADATEPGRTVDGRGGRAHRSQGVRRDASGRCATARGRGHGRSNVTDAVAQHHAHQLGVARC